MYTLKSIAQRGTLFGAAFALLAAAILPAAPAFADALNPLTERSLLLSSSAPGYTDTDGSGNAETSFGSPPGSGPNGKKTGQTFTFNVSTDSAATGKAIKAFTLQYCTKAAGLCFAPGNNAGDADSAGDGSVPSTRADNATSHPLNKSDLDIVGTFTNTTTAAAPAGGQFQVLVNDVAQNGWSIETINAESHVEHTAPDALTGKKNMIRLTNATGISPTAGQKIDIVFKASTDAYITNPGAGSFFVKINTYQSEVLTDLIPNVPAMSNDDIIDGGVTVANVMTDSIHITTKVLETMAFSVGTENRDKIDVTNGGESPGAVHGTCDPVMNVDNNRLDLGDESAEFSLDTRQAYDANSYWRLSSNSSGGATVYYSGNTLANTVGDEIAQAGPTKVINTPGTEQFGLGFVDAGLDDFDNAFDLLVSAPDSRHKNSESFPFRTLSTQTTGKYDIATLPSQSTSNEYNAATGTLGTDGAPGTAQIAFLKSSLTVPVPIAQQNEQVISCATAKMRYIANIGADTPAGVYTTKINYLAAPQY